MCRGWLAWRWWPLVGGRVVGLVSGLGGLFSGCEGSGEEAGHLGSGGRVPWAEGGRVGGASQGDPGGCEGVDVGAVGVVGGVFETGGFGCGDLEGSCEEAGHLGAGDWFVGAVFCGFGGASQGDSELGEAFGVTGPPQVGTHILEAWFGWLGGVLPVDYPYQPHRHFPAPDGFSGAKLPAAAAGAVQDSS